MGGTALGKLLPRLSREKYNEIVMVLKRRLKPEFYHFVGLMFLIPILIIAMQSSASKEG